jgi:hypothetical protein
MAPSLDRATVLGYLVGLREPQLTALIAEAAELRRVGEGGDAPQFRPQMRASRAVPSGDDQYVAGSLLRATMGDDLVEVTRWLEAGIDPNAPHETLGDWSPLHFAAQGGHRGILLALLDANAEPQPKDRQGHTPLVHAGFWGNTSAVDLLLAHGGGERDAVPARMTVSSDRFLPKRRVTVLCSAPEFSRGGDNVMAALFALCEAHSDVLKFGYDWGGSSTAEPSDTDPGRVVPSCCHSLSCTCDVRGSGLIRGPVDWSNPLSVAGSMWFPKYKTKIMSTISSEAQRPGVRYIEVLCIDGGPVSQLERRTAPAIIHGAITDLRGKGLSIGLLGEEGDSEQTARAPAIQVFLSTLDYGAFLRRFFPLAPITASGMCSAAQAGVSQKL